MEITKDNINIANINIDNLLSLLNKIFTDKDSDDSVCVYLSGLKEYLRFCYPSSCITDAECNNKCMDNLISFLTEIRRMNKC